MKKNYKHMPYWWYKIMEIQIHKKHFRCINCDINFYENFKWIVTSKIILIFIFFIYNKKYKDLA